LAPTGTLYKRKEHALFDVLSFVGGFAITLAFLIKLLINPIQRFAFRMRAIKRLYFARTSEDKLFPSKKSSDLFFDNI
jgi:hypothetical protein